MKRFLILLVLATCGTGLFMPSGSQAQNAPVTTAATVGGALPGPVSVPLTVTGFTNIGAVSLTIDFDNSVIHFTGATPHPQMGGFAYGEQDLGTGLHRITMGWYASTGLTLPNGTAIITLNFTYLGGTTALTWYDNGPTCEYADAVGNVLADTPASAYYINGSVCGAVGNPGTIAGDNSVCRGEHGVTYSVAPVANATGYVWSVPPGALLVNGGNTNSIMVDYPAGALSGTVSVHGIDACGNGPVSQLPVTVNALPVANAGNDLQIPYGTSTTLSAASGGTGTYSYQWSPASLLVNPNLQNPQTVNLYTTNIFKLLVTNQSTLCHDSDEVTVAITGGPLSTNPAAQPTATCSGQASQLSSNAGGGSGTYSYLWTSLPAGTPPWSSTLANPTVAPAVSTQYLLTLSDGFNTTSGSTSVTVRPLPSATISGGDSLCDNGSTATLTIDLTGTPPWYFIYTDGVNAYTVSGQMTTPYLVTTSDPGNWTVLFVQDANCTGTGYGTAAVWVFPVPVAPVVTQNGSELHSGSCCGNQWYLDDAAIPGATGQLYTTTASGRYYDIATVNGCSSDTSNVIDVLVGLDPEKIDGISFYPNPAGAHVTFRCASPGNRHFRIRFTDLYGMTVKEFITDISSVENKKIIDTGDLAPGFYLVQVGEGNKTQYMKLIIE